MINSYMVTKEHWGFLFVLGALALNWPFLYIFGAALPYYLFSVWALVIICTGLLASKDGKRKEH